MVINTNEHTRKTPAKQREETVPRKPMKIGAGTLAGALIWLIPYRRIEKVLPRNDT